MRLIDIAVFVAAATFSASALAQTRSGGTMAFLDVPQVTRLVGAGGLHATGCETSPSMVFHNPACVNDTSSGVIGLTVTPVADGIKYASTAYSHNIDRLGTLTAGLLYVGYGDFTRTDEEGEELGRFTANEGALYLSLSKQMAPWLTLGATFKPIFSKLADYTSFAMAMDFGANVVKADGRLSIGLTLSNAGAIVKRYSNDDTRKPLPTDLRIGLAYKAEHAPFRFLLTLKDLTEWDLTTSGRKNSFGDNLLRHTLIGLEFAPVRAFYLTFGYDHRRRKELTDDDAGGMAGFAWGAGLNVAKISVQYAHNRYHEAGSLNSITLSTNWRRWIR